MLNLFQVKSTCFLVQSHVFIVKKSTNFSWLTPPCQDGHHAALKRSLDVTRGHAPRMSRHDEIFMAFIGDL